MPQSAPKTVRASAPAGIRRGEVARRTHTCRVILSEVRRSGRSRKPALSESAKRTSRMGTCGWSFCKPEGAGALRLLNHCFKSTRASAQESWGGTGLNPSSQLAVWPQNAHCLCIWKPSRLFPNLQLGPKVVDGLQPQTAKVAQNLVLLPDWEDRDKKQREPALSDDGRVHGLLSTLRARV